MTATGSVPAGTRVGRYEIVSLLRQGGMGEVYSAEDSQLGRRVALKILPKHRTSDPERVARFVREVRASATLNHPSIVAVHDAGHDGDVHFLAMELIEGVPLSEWMRRRRSIAGRVELMAQVAEGLAKAHDAGIVHRDLKPDNIMVTADHHAKIVDFGVAKLTERVGERSGSTGITTPTSRVGTTAYMSPEQVEGKPLDHRTDVFSFGTVLYELLTGTNPFSAPQYADTLHNVVHREPALDRIPKPLRRVVRRCLRKEPALRYDSLRDTALDLREALEEVEPNAPRKQRNAWIAVIALASIAAAWWLTRGANDPKPEQRGMLMTRLTNSGRVMTAAISPDGKYLVHAVREREGQALYVKQIATGTVTKIAGAAPRYYLNLTVSPDSNYAYYDVTERSEPNVNFIEQLPLLGGTPRRIASDTESWYSLSPDGTRLVFRRFNALTRESAITVAAVDGSGEQVVLRRKRPDSLELPVWTHDGKAITFLAGNVTQRGSTLQRLTLATGDIAVVPTPKFPGVDSYAWLPDGSGALVCVYEREQPQQIWFVPAGETTARKITSEVSAYFGVKPTADSKSFSVVRDVADSNVYLTTLDGKPERALTSGVGNWVGGGAGGVRWLNDREVAFSSHTNGMNTFFAVDVNGGAPRRLIQNVPVRSLVVSPDRTHIAFVSDQSGSNEIWIADASGANARQLTRGTNSAWPSFTPDGKSVVYLRFDDAQRVWRTPIDGKGQSVPITNIPTNRPSVSPDGKWLLCRLRSVNAPSSNPLPPGGRGQGEGVSVPLWRTAIVPLANERHGKREPRYFAIPRSGGPPMTQWHPNGRAFLYTDYVDDIANVWIQDIDGGEPRQLTFFTSGEIYSFALAQDGNRLVITRGQGTSDAMLVREFR
ncbi:MAG TPA: protein kinase [Thermoanaerobaculia bacterium]|nr:protein kinase [Thermoanaerobaculia bacterium]